MTVRVDYRCGRCGGVAEQRVTPPPPPTSSCIACGAEARRIYSPLALVGRAATPAERPPAAQGPAPCLVNRDVPALCHLDPSVAPAWIARARGDNRALERELARQEAALAGGAAPSIGGSHHGHGHAHVHPPSQGHQDHQHDTDGPSRTPAS